LTRNQSFARWPGIVIAWLLASYLLPHLVPGGFLYGILGGLLGVVAILLWWLLFSRAPWSERLGAIALVALAVAATKPLVHVSIATAGQGMLFYIHAIRLLGLAFALWVVSSRSLGAGARWATLAATTLAACGLWTLLRTGGITGDGTSDFAWRWSKTPEEELLSRVPSEAPMPPAPPAPAVEVEEKALPETPPAAPAEEKEEVVAIEKPAPLSPVTAETQEEPEWPGFRGPSRDGVVSGVSIRTDWSTSPPAEVWRRPVGPGWSSFAVAFDLIYTQEQRGDEEVVAAYDRNTGEPVWQHADPVRFYESNGGPGPRGTPTYHRRRVYAFGATGILNALDAEDGSVVWSRPVAADAEAEIPGWGFASSPLVVGDVVLVAAGGRLVAYHIATGELRWVGPKGGGGYSSPHFLAIDGVEQVLLQSANGVASFAPENGALLWEHVWDGFRIVQPARIGNGDLVVSSSDAAGGIATRRITVALGTSGWNVEERWTSRGLKPYFNDFVVHDGHAYGFDGSILSSIGVEDGKRNWKGGRYGHGQLVLLRDQGLLLVLSEEGELALVAATPDQFQEIARFKAIEGKTWNHPVLVRDFLLVRNGEEMAAFRLSRADGAD
jgi:outer membrane protein assembly factor BamB